LRFTSLKRRTALALVTMAVTVPLAVVGAPTSASADSTRFSAQASPNQAVNASEEQFRTKFVRAGDWRTLESFFNASGTGFFLHPAGAQIKVRYGVGFLGFDRQKQTLDGFNEKQLSVGAGSIAQARMQIRVSQDTWVNYVVRP
jgi:hypothetical protein